MPNPLFVDIASLKIEEELRLAAIRTESRMKRELDRTQPARRDGWKMPRWRYALTYARRGSA